MIQSVNQWRCGGIDYFLNYFLGIGDTPNKKGYRLCGYDGIYGIFQKVLIINDMEI